MQFSIFVQFPPLETVWREGGTPSGLLLCGCLCYSLYFICLVRLASRHFAGIRVTSVSEQILQQPAEG